MARRVGLACALLSLWWIIGCGGSGGGSPGAVDLIPFAGSRTFQVNQLSGQFLSNASLTLTVTDLQARASAKEEVTVRLTSSDGLFNDTVVTVTALTVNRLEGTATAGGETYLVVIVFSADGNNLSITLTRQSDKAQVQGEGVVVSINDPDDGDQADPILLATATAKLSALLTAVARGDEVTDAQIMEARDAFAAARLSGLQDPSANFGFALLHVAATATEIEGRVDYDALLGQGGSDGVGTMPRMLSSAAQFYNPAGVVMGLADAPTATIDVALLPLAMENLPHRAADAEAVAAIRDELTNSFLPALALAREAIGVSLAASPFSYQVSFTDAGSEVYALAFGHPEVELMAAMLDTLYGAANLLLIYDTTLPTDGQRPITEAELADGLLTPQEYLPPTPFGTIRSDGQARSQAAVQALQSASARLRSAWSTINEQNSLAGQDLATLLPADIWTQDLRTKITAGLAELEQLFAGPYHVDWAFLTDTLNVEVPAGFQDLDVSLDLVAFWNNPPADMRAVLPTFGDNNQGFFDSDLRYSVGAYPVGDGAEEVYGSWPTGAGGAVSFGGLVSPPVDHLVILRTIHIDMSVYRPFDPGSDTGYDWAL